MGIWTGDYGHEHRYVGGAHAQSGRYSSTRHVAAICRDSDEKNARSTSRKETASKAASGIGAVFNWLAR